MIRTSLEIKSNLFYHKTVNFVQPQINPLKPKTMGIDLMKQQLMERIQTGDEKHIRVLLAVSNALVAEDFDLEAYEASLKPMTLQELIARAEASNEDIEAGRVYTREEVEAALGL